MLYRAPCLRSEPHDDRIAEYFTEILLICYEYIAVLIRRDGMKFTIELNERQCRTIENITIDNLSRMRYHHNVHPIYEGGHMEAGCVLVRCYTCHRIIRHRLGSRYVGHVVDQIPEH